MADTGRKPQTVEGVADKGKLAFAREQRKEPTRGEEILWQALRGKKLGVRFRRQHPLEDFVLDFYSPQARLAVEVDGASHREGAEYDQWRDGVLASWGIPTLRFSESDVQKRLRWVLSRIRETPEESGPE